MPSSIRQLPRIGAHLGCIDPFFPFTGSSTDIRLPLYSSDNWSISLTSTFTPRQMGWTASVLCILDLLLTLLYHPPHAVDFASESAFAQGERDHVDHQDHES